MRVNSLFNPDGKKKKVSVWCWKVFNMNLTVANLLTVIEQTPGSASQATASQLDSNNICFHCDYLQLPSSYDK